MLLKQINIFSKSICCVCDVPKLTCLAKHYSVLYFSPCIFFFRFTPFVKNNTMMPFSVELFTVNLNDNIKRIE